MIYPELEEYFLLVAQRPELFRNGAIQIITDRDRMISFMEQSGRKLGVVYKSPFNMMVVDLVCEGEREFAYERLIPTAIGDPVVCVPLCGDKFVLMRQYRHAMRTYQYAFPRGYGENGLSAEENAAKELCEEIGAEVIRVEKLGEVVADSGVSGTVVPVMLCRVSDFRVKKGYEGIEAVELLSESEISHYIASGKINDGFTLSAFSMWQNRNR